MIIYLILLANTDKGTAVKANTQQLLGKQSVAIGMPGENCRQITDLSEIINERTNVRMTVCLSGWMTEGRKKGRKEWSDDTQHALHWLEREIAQWVHPMKDRSDDPSHHEQTLLPRSYISLLIYGMGIVQDGYAGFLSLYVNASLSYVDFCCLFVRVNVGRVWKRFYLTIYSTHFMLKWCQTHGEGPLG